jgi:hypothetical protein
MRRILAPIAFFFIAIVSGAAVFVIHGIERPGSAITAPAVDRAFSPNDDGSGDTASISYGIKRAPEVTDTIEHDGETVATILQAHRGKGRVTTTWDGLDAHGKHVDPGARYEVHIDLSESRSYELPATIGIDLEAPTVERAVLDTAFVAKEHLARAAVYEAAGASERFLELDGKQLTTASIRRAKSTRRLEHKTFFITSRLPDDVTAAEAARVVLVLVDSAGNRLTVKPSLSKTELSIAEVVK